MNNVNQEWLNQNALRAYPLRENVTRTPVDSTGNILTDVLLPNYVIVDFSLCFFGDIKTRVYISKIVYSFNILTFVISDSNNTQIGVCSINLDMHIRNMCYTVSCSGEYEDAICKIVIGDLTNLASDFSEGVFNFTIEATEFEPSTIRPMLRGVHSLKILNDNVESDAIYGDVKLIAGPNIRLSYMPMDNAIRIDAIDGAGFNDECNCPDSIGNKNIVKRINGIALEDINIIGDGRCVEVKTEGNNLIIHNVCSEPCCGCPELELITKNLQILDVSLKNLEDYSTKLYDKLTNFITTYILTIGA